jgi:hypothetical protein
MQNTGRPEVPFDELRAAAGEHPEATGALGDFHAEYSSEAPDAARLRAHAERVQGFEALAGPFERWWLSPGVVAFVAELNATGI